MKPYGIGPFSFRLKVELMKTKKSVIMDIKNRGNVSQVIMNRIGLRPRVVNAVLVPPVRTYLQHTMQRSSFQEKNGIGISHCFRTKSP